MTNGATKTYEMLWDCEYCGSKKLLGKSHRHCPECGAAQNPDKRYFPEESEKVAVEDHVFYGADRACPACATPNSAKAKFCCDCGSPLDEAAEVKRIEDPNAPPPPAPGHRPAPPKKQGMSTGKKVGLFVGLGLGLLTIVFVLVAIFWTKTVAISVTGHTWQREVQIEDFNPRAKSEWCDMMPSDAYGVSRTQEVRSYKDVPDGETCTTRRVDNGDGTYSERQECTTNYRQEPVYDDKCHFTVDRWEYARSITAQGGSVAEAPYWPEVQLRQAGVAPTHNKGKRKGRKVAAPTIAVGGNAAFGTEREGQRIETYKVHYLGAEQEQYTCDFPELGWRAIPVSSQWNGEASVITGILDCSTLRPLGAAQ